MSKMEAKYSAVLEKSTNTHTLKSVNEIEAKTVGTPELGIIKIKKNGNSYVQHGEHGTLAIEQDNVIKYVQQELNPITGAIQNAFD